jgi:hypothetical protein
MLHDGMEVMVNTGGPDIPGVIRDASYPCAAVAATKSVRVNTGRSTQWLPPEAVRPMVLADHKRIFGQRFCDWHYALYYTLLMHYLHGFEQLDRQALVEMWEAGWTVAATARKIAAAQGWQLICKEAHLTAPVHIRHYVADLGLNAAGQVEGGRL